MTIKIVADSSFAVVLTRDEVQDVLDACRAEVAGWAWHAWAETYPEENDDGTLSKFRVAMGPGIMTHPSFYFIRFYGGMEDA